MQIDFHHGVTYIVARLAGFEPPQADVIAHSAQYVDDATLDGTIEFANGAQYTRIASAHKMLDYKNMDALADHTSWLPFHFLPGNLGEAAPTSFTDLTPDDYLARCVCKPDSFVARDMMQDVICRQERPYALHRLGIASHVYIDTWAHQGFVGYQHPINRASNITTTRPQRTQALKDRLGNLFGDTWDSVKSELVSNVLPLGHGAVLSFPDQPYMKWRYTNGLGERVVRDNPADFGQAVRHLYQFYKRYQAYGAATTAADQAAALAQTFPEPAQLALIDTYITQFTDEDGDQRHQKWLALIADGTFGFAEIVNYVDKGVGSWKATALGTDLSDKDEAQYPYTPAFLNSDWKRFHDALQVHRLHILNELLPRYGLTAA